VDIIDFAAQVIFISVPGVLSPGPLFFANLIYGSKQGFYSGVKIASGHTIVELPLIIIVALSVFGFSSFILTKEGIRIIGLLGGIVIAFKRRFNIGISLTSYPIIIQTNSRSLSQALDPGPLPYQDLYLDNRFGIYTLISDYLSFKMKVLRNMKTIPY
jgi:hypothetical protein